MARDEVLALMDGNSLIDANLLIVDCKSAVSSKDVGILAGRLAYSRTISSLLFHCSYENLLSALEEFSWKDVYDENFSIRIKNLAGIGVPFAEQQLADILWRNLDNPNVKMKYAKTQIILFFTSNQVYCTKLIAEVDSSFEERKAHKRPKLHPTSMHPKLARAMINLTGIDKGRIYDPFCGSGGILIEAGIIGLEPVGYDIDQNMIERAVKNLSHFKINAKLMKKDAARIRESMDYVATDLPYGRSSRGKELEKLYLSFLKNLKKRLKKQAVISFPDFVDYKKIIEEAGFSIKKEYDYYLHKSLSKRIVVI